jgi:hypothetical protein
MARGVELIYDKEIKSNKIVGTIQSVIGYIVFLMSIGFLLIQGPNAVFALSFLSGIFMIVTGMYTRRR